MLKSAIIFSLYILSLYKSIEFENETWNRKTPIPWGRESIRTE